MTSSPVGDGALIHRAARIEDAVHRLRARLGRARGLRTTIVPFTGYGSTSWVRVLCRVVLARPPRNDKPESVRGWRSFLSVPLDDVAVRVRVGDVEIPVPAARGGVIDVRIDVALEPGWHEATVWADDVAPVTAAVFVVDPAVRAGLLSDIDDTVMVTALPRPLLAAWNTFVLDEHARRPVPGMAVLYERFVRDNPGAPVVYLSTGSWNVAPTLTRFLERHLYPAGTLLLTDWGPTVDRWFRSGREHKRSSLERLSQEFPDLHWLLVGDDGQHDEEIYGAFATTHPANVSAVAIRQLTTGEAVLAGGRSRESDTHGGAPWVYAPDGAGLAEQLADHGLVADSGSSQRPRI
jgi:phosphatidate phosphatase APP1